MRLLLLILISGIPGYSQYLGFSPGATLEKTIPGSYYNTDYIFISNQHNQVVSLRFELVEEIVPEACAASGCTNLVCYTSLPESGPLGDLPPGEEAYFSINLAANNFAGDVKIRYAIYDENNPAIRDTIAFIYHSEPDSAVSPQPWAQLNFSQNVLTLFVRNATIETRLYLFDTGGKLILEQPAGQILSVSLESLATGTYIAVVKNAGGQRITRKLVLYN